MPISHHFLEGFYFIHFYLFPITVQTPLKAQCVVRKYDANKNLLPDDPLELTLGFMVQR